MINIFRQNQLVSKKSNNNDGTAIASNDPLWVGISTILLYVSIIQIPLWVGIMSTLGGDRVLLKNTKNILYIDSKMRNTYELNLTLKRVDAGYLCPLAPLTLHRPVQGKKTVIRKVNNVKG